MSEIQKRNFVPVTFAKELARKVNLQTFKDNRNVAVQTKSTADSQLYPNHPIVGTYTINDKNDLPALYLFTYGENQGFSIISADLRYDPVCAYVPDGTYNPDDSIEIPSTLYAWIGFTVEYIEKVRDSTIDNSALASYQWCRAIDNSNLASVMGNLGLSMSFEDLDSQSNIFNYTYSGAPAKNTRWSPSLFGWPWWGHNCGSNYTYQYGPLMTTKWGQGCYYNDQCPPSCTYNCGHMLTGCVATAMAQVLKYMNKGCTNGAYNFSTMPNSLNQWSSPSSISSVAGLMYACGAYSNMNYGCSESGTGLPNAVNAFSSHFCVYSSQSSYNQNTVVTSLNTYNNPVLLSGCSEQHIHGFWPIKWYTYSQCHLWVCDGYLGTKNNCYTLPEKFSMNWGWDGFANGWYSVNSAYTAGGFNFQYNNEMIYDIH